jgi:outer membrane biosynthesis protein TonB
MNWLHYLAEANLYLGVFYLAYCLLLSRETYYQLNRLYLIAGCMISFVLPVLQLGFIKPAEVAATVPFDYAAPVEQLPQLPVTTIAVPVVAENQLSVNEYLWYAYLLGACVLFILLAIKLYSLLKLVKGAQCTAHNQYKLVTLPQTDIAFSFFNYLFIGADASGANTIIRHELVHIRQKHSVDIVFLELLKIINWFNPCIYLLQNSLKTVHEYIADEQTAAFETDALTYSTFLVNNAYGSSGSSITHSFFNYNLLKKRIIMLNQKRSGSLARLKYLIAVPICAGFLCASTLAFSKDYGWDIAPASPAEVKAAAKEPSSKKLVIPIPSFTTPGYEYLNHNVMKAVTYNPAENDKGTFVIVGFNVGDNGKLSDIRIEKSGGKDYDLKALKAYTSFNMPIKDKPGHRRSVIIFYNGQPTAETDPVRLAPDCVGSWVICGGAFTYKTRRTIKGFEYDEYLENINNKFNARVVVYDANGKYVHISENQATVAELALLKNKYGYSFPSLPNTKVKLSPPVRPKPAPRKRDKNGAYVSEGRLNNGPVPIQTIAPAGTKALFIVDGKKYEFTPEILAKYNAKSLLYMSCDKMVVYDQGNAYAQKTWGKYGKVAVLTGNASINIVENPFGKENQAATPDTAKSDWQKLGIYFSRNIKYPSADRQETIGGRVITLFSVNADHTLQYAKVIRMPSAAMGNEVIRVLKKCAELDILTPGRQYVLPVTFSLGYEDSSEIINLKSRGTGEAEIYNPNGIDISPDKEGRSLADIVIRGYVKKS